MIGCAFLLKPLFWGEVLESSGAAMRAEREKRASRIRTLSERIDAEGGSPTPLGLYRRYWRALFWMEVSEEDYLATKVVSIGPQTIADELDTIRRCPLADPSLLRWLDQAEKGVEILRDYARQSEASQAEAPKGVETLGDDARQSEASQAEAPVTPEDAPKSQPPAKLKCQRCGREGESGDGLVCPGCGRTQWGCIGSLLVAAVVLVAMGFGLYGYNGWVWVWIILGGLPFLVALWQVIRSLTWSKPGGGAQQERK
jgi:hypothetical protein